ncbi:signal recognition particle-docking protein FtsY [Candidatus Woesearchaeota archaeon]|nr:signal recognition particle-docking protein FtsY [Candidatus Woesearchaeota archaeon]
MFKFLKDKLKGALSSFSKKVDEVAKEETVEDVTPETPATPETSSATPSTETASSAETSPAPGIGEPGVAANVEAEPAKKSVEESVAAESEESPQEKQDEANIPVLPQPEKKGFFARIKEKFTKKEEVVEEAKEPVPEVSEETEDVVIEDAEVEVEGAPLRKVKIHDHIDDERPHVERLFEPIEPETPRKEKKKLGEPEDFTPDKIQSRLEDVEIDEEHPTHHKIEKKETPIKPVLVAQKPRKTITVPKPVVRKSIEEIKEEPAEIVTSAPVVEKPEKKGFFTRIKEAITTKKLSAQQFEDLFWDVEVALLENNVAVEVIEKLKSDLKVALVDQPIPRGKIDETILATLKQSLADLFAIAPIDLLEKVKTKQPFIICLVGINGSGKTTTIAKLTHLLQQHQHSVVIAAADTFRAAAIDQLQQHADKLGVKLVRHDYGSDPAAVAFDAIKHAEAAKKDVVLIDTAGRLHSNINLVDEMKKIVRVAKPDMILFIGESITGNDCVAQAQQFNDAVGIDGIILSKADIDEKGGAAISVSYVTKKPILYLGTGQTYDDLKVFDANLLIESLGL